MNSSTSSQLLRICGMPFSQSLTRSAAPSLSSVLRHAQPLATTTTGSLARHGLAPAQSRSSLFSTYPSARSQVPDTDSIPTTTTPPTSVPLPHGVSRSFGTVISAGRMQRTVRVEHINIKFNKQVQKRFAVKETYKVSDPRNSLRVGDKIEFWSGRRVSKHVRHVVERIVVPFGTPIEDRPPVMTYSERLESELNARKERRLRRMGLDKDQAADVEVTGEVKIGRIRERVMKRLEREEERQLGAKELNVAQ
ncbi:uncharacterized protein GIQ15_00104 [Arthroderma uncinatum]|uniref:uncharacterized protein n=1 Tax=Arthroderma uncinatum TaxID=74035 RepID=UPI00144A8B49|nr:uncharacterized protein GIQ15_00104 [Arthroderma uncinatum]KAF3490587.1 hypothetical protein GIQ15_00104 [Arthroderma uncinatum]